MERNKIYNGDCLEGIKELPGGSIDVVITDPPYFQGLTHNGQKGSLSDLNISAYFFKALFTEMRRVVKPDGCIYFFTDWRGYAFYYPLFDSSLGASNMLVWDKQSGPGNHYGFVHELILLHTGRGLKGVGNNVIRDIKGFAAGAKKEDGEKVHPTQKPVALISKLIEDSTAPDQTVLDCFMGSGTTAIAALETGRNFIGFEIDERYYEVADNRIRAWLEEHMGGYHE